MKLRSRRPGPFRSLPTFRTPPSLLASSRAWLGRAPKNVSPTPSAPTALARLHPPTPLGSLFLFQPHLGRNFSLVLTWSRGHATSYQRRKLCKRACSLVSR